MEMLIKNGAHVNARNRFNDTALILAVNGGSTKVSEFYTQKTSKQIVFFCLEFEKAAEFLIKKGSDVNIVGDHGETALLVAAGKSKKKNTQTYLHIPLFK